MLSCLLMHSLDTGKIWQLTWRHWRATFKHKRRPVPLDQVPCDHLLCLWSSLTSAVSMCEYRVNQGRLDTNGDDCTKSICRNLWFCPEISHPSSNYKVLMTLASMTGHLSQSRHFSHPTKMSGGCFISPPERTGATRETFLVQLPSYLTQGEN